MNQALGILPIATLLLIVFTPVHAETSYGALDLNCLKGSKVGEFPRRWRTWPLQRGKAKEVYTVAEEKGQRFIRAIDSKDLSQQIFLNFYWDIEKRPMLSWKWRATKLPEGAKESVGSKNDSACGVYVVIGRYSGHALKYVWSSTLPAGTIVSRHEGKLKIKVLDSGSAKTKSWVEQTVDVIKDYKALFGEDLKKNPSGIGLLTDGNALHTAASCDYADFRIAGSKAAFKEKPAP